jgi:UDP-2-acetamido-2,6-beta-L-arabino-hexul-4-ose reductase
MNIAITGSEGFLGKNFYIFLKYSSNHKIHLINRTTSKKKFLNILNISDIIFHFAGSNREKKKYFIRNNIKLTQDIINILEKKKKSTRLIFSSTSQVKNKNNYGISKIKAEKILRERKSKKIEVLILRLPNLFGKWSKPYYNSVVSTFCKQAISSKPLEIHQKKTLKLLYIDDLIRYLLLMIKKKFVKKTIYKFNGEVKISLSKLKNIIESFKKLKENEIPKRISNKFIKNLYSTYLSFLEKKDIKQKLKSNRDNRGHFVEMIKNKQFGQLSYISIKPGKTRGSHFHMTKTERFYLIEGKVKFIFKNLYNNSCYSKILDDKNFEYICTIPGTLHKLINTQKKDAKLIIWSNEVYDKKNHDTYYENF